MRIIYASLNENEPPLKLHPFRCKGRNVRRKGREVKMDEMKDYLDDNLCIQAPENGIETPLGTDFPPPAEEGEGVGVGVDLVYRDIWWV